MLEKLSSFIWGKGTVALLLATGVLYTVKLKMIQFKLFPYVFKRIRRSKNIRSQFGTFCMSLGAAMGTGNITGVAYAVRIGGAGAVFWMWISAFSGMALVYAENALSAEYSDDHVKGPMAYIKYGLGSSSLAAFFAVCCLTASFGMGGMVQVSAMSENLSSCISIPPVFLWFLLFVAIYAVINGGAKRISRISGILLPSASLLYFISCFLAVFQSRERLAAVLSDIFSSAFGVRPFLGGTTGYAVSKAVTEGIKRGIFSNEAGLGSSPILHSSAVNASTRSQCMSSMLEVFTDTVICCTVTALTVLCASGNLTIETAFKPVTGGLTDIILSIIMTVFALCTVIGWSYCALTAFRHLFGDKGKVFAFTFSAISASGAVIRSETVWEIADIFNGLMVFPNIIALLLLHKKVRAE